MTRLAHGVLLLLSMDIAGCSGEVGTLGHADAGPNLQGDGGHDAPSDAGAATDGGQGPLADAAAAPDGSEPDACDGLTCSGHGTCSVIAAHAVCTCEPGYHVDGSDCVNDEVAPSACAPAPTSDLVVDVTDRGARGDGRTDDTAAIQAAVDEVAGTGGTVLVPDGTYLVDALTHVRLASNMPFRMTSGAVLQALPNGSGSYDIIRVESVSDVAVVGGTLQGERDDHTGDSGEWGMGLSLRGASRVVVEGVTVRDCWGDGFYVGGETTDATFCSVVADRNRRQGMSIVSANGVVIQDSIFENTLGTPPAVGIDLEPNAGETVQNVQVLRSQILDNAGGGLSVNGIAATSSIVDARIDGNTITGSEAGIYVIHTEGHQVTGNTIVTGWVGIRLVGATGNVVTLNSITAENPVLDDTGGNTIEDNVFP